LLPYFLNLGAWKAQARGAGVILQTVREGRLNIRDIYIVNVFLVICHGIIDDTAIFIAIGAEGLWIVLPRVITALVVCYLLSRILKPAAEPEVPQAPATPR